MSSLKSSERCSVVGDRLSVVLGRLLCFQSSILPSFQSSILPALLAAGMMMAGMAHGQSLQATGGGTVTNYTDAGGTNWTAHIFTNSVNATLTTNFNVTAAGPGDWVEYLIIAGGGGGAAGNGGAGGGGGAGGYRCSVQGELSGSNSTAETRYFVVVSNYPIVVGAGGTGGGDNGNKGADSSFDDIVSEGGGAGYNRSGPAGGDGGSGGGKSSGSEIGRAHV